MRQEKQLILDEIRGMVDQYGSFIIMSYAGLSAEQSTSLRNQIAEKGGDVEIVRKRILLKAAQEAGITLELEQLNGHIGLVFGGSDPIETTKTVFAFSKDNANVLDIIGGRFDGELYTGEQVEQLSKLPSKDAMRAQLLSVLQAPLTQTLATFEAILTSVIYCLEQKSQKDQ